MTNLLDKSKYIKGLSMKTIGDLIPLNRTTLIYGRSGCGKSVSILKYLNKHNEIPYFIDFDSNDNIESLASLNHIDGYLFWDNISTSNKDEVKQELSDKVFIIDTYAMADNYIKAKTDNKYSVTDLCSMLTSFGSTVIVIAHAIYYSGKDAEPDVDTIWSNHIGCKLHLHKDILKTKTNIYLEVEKLRGYNGPDIINDWMR